MNRLPFILLLSFLCGCSGQSQEVDILLAKEQEVLKMAQAGKVYEFVVSTNPIYRVSISYVGAYVNSEDVELEFLNVIRFTGLFEDAVKANGRLVVYSDDKRVGYFPIGNRTSLPSGLTDDGQLIFPPGENCVDSTRIDVSSQLPERIFVICNGEYGDLYELLKKD